MPPDSGTKPTSKGDGRADMDTKRGCKSFVAFSIARVRPKAECMVWSMRYKMEMEHNILEPSANEDGTEWNIEWNGEREQAAVIKKMRTEEKRQKKKRPRKKVM